MRRCRLWSSPGIHLCTSELFHKISMRFNLLSICPILEELFDILGAPNMTMSWFLFLFYLFIFFWMFYAAVSACRIVRERFLKWHRPNQRMVMHNICELVHWEQVFSRQLRHENFMENELVFNCFRLLYLSLELLCIIYGGRLLSFLLITWEDWFRCLVSVLEGFKKNKRQ